MSYATSLGIPLIQRSDPESRRNGTAINQMLLDYVDCDQVNAALHSIDAKLTSFQQALANAGLGPSARASIHQPLQSPDGARKTFGFTGLPDAGSYLLVWNGQVLTVNNDFTQSGSEVTTVIAPGSSDSFWAFY
jgi:hypothetical protein